VQVLLERLVVTGQEAGSLVAAYRDGARVVDATVRESLGLPAAPGDGGGASDGCREP
jgi:hypothetical protein